MRRAIKKQQWVLNNGAEDKTWDERHIGNGADVPGARCAILMIANRTVVLVMMNDAKHERDAQVQQTHQANHYTGFRHAELEFGVSRCESQAWFGNPHLQEVVKESDGLSSFWSQ